MRCASSSRADRCLLALFVSLLLLAAPPGLAAGPDALKAKAEQVKGALQEYAAAGGDPRPYVRRMQGVKRTIRSGDFGGADRELDRILADLELSHAALAAPTGGADAPLNREWTDPRRVEIVGSTLDEMEVGFSPDESLLFFNDREKPNKDLHWARRLDDGRYRYMGRMRNVNTRQVDASPVTDDDGRIYYTSLGRYSPWRDRFETMYVARFVDGEVVDPEPLTGDIYVREKRWVSLDTDVSPDASRIHFSQGYFDGETPSIFYLVEAEREGDHEYRVRSGSLDAVNAEGTLNYAPSTSADGTELYFTRAARVNGFFRIDGIYVSKRATAEAPWGPPEKIEAIRGVVEAPCLSRDGKRLYYHKQEGDRVVIYRVDRR